MNKGEETLGNIWDMINKKITIDSKEHKEIFKGYNPSEIHCIEYIGKNEYSNVTKLADKFCMTRGAISKLTKKMIAKGLISDYQKEDNQKEIYFRLTKKGKEIFDKHESLNKKLLDRDEPMFSQITKEEYEAINNFTKKYTKHLDSEMQKLGMNIKVSNYDKL